MISLFLYKITWLPVLLKEFVRQSQAVHRLCDVVDSF